MDPCAHCPVTGRTCPAVARDHPRYCEKVDPSGPAYDARFVPILLDETPPPPAPREVPSAVGAGPSRVTLARRLQIVTCPYRENCGCQAPKCWARGRIVVLTDCEACMPR